MEGQHFILTVVSVVQHLCWSHQFVFLVAFRTLQVSLAQVETHIPMICNQYCLSSRALLDSIYDLQLLLEGQPFIWTSAYVHAHLCWSHLFAPLWLLVGQYKFVSTVESHIPIIHSQCCLLSFFSFFILYSPHFNIPSSRDLKKQEKDTKISIYMLILNQK
jgi:hypothetical protein